MAPGTQAVEQKLDGIIAQLKTAQIQALAVFFLPK